MNSILLSPLSIPLHTSHNHISVFVGNANLASIRAPLHITDGGHLPVIDHLFDPLPIVLHEDDDSAGGVTGGQLTIFIIPDYKIDVSGVVRQVCTLVTL